MDAWSAPSGAPAGNVSPQLVTAELLREMTAVFR
jgi:hypothetical protein